MSLHLLLTIWGVAGLVIAAIPRGDSYLRITSALMGAFCLGTAFGLLAKGASL